MKKFLAIVFAALLVLGLAASAFAIHAEIPSETQAVVAKGTTQITLGGSIRVRGETRSNTKSLSDGAFYGAVVNGTEHHSGSYDQRIRLSLDAKVADNVQGFVMLETGGDTSDVYTWGTSSSAAKGGYTEGNAKRGSLNINEGWILVKGAPMGGVPMGLKVGHMPLSLGNKMFFDHTKLGDDAIVVFADPTKELHIGLLTAKFTEASTEVVGNAGDSDAYVLLATYKGASFNIGADYTSVQDQNLFTSYGATLNNIGLRGDVMVAGMVKIKADIEMQSGKAEHGAGGAATSPDVKFKGSAIMLGAEAKLGDVNLVLEYATGSGDEDANSPTIADDNDVESFITSLGADVHYTYVYEYRTINVCGQASGGLCNTTYIKLGGNTKVGAFGIAANLFLLSATENVQNYAGESTDDIGTEIDAKVTYSIAKNLTYWVEGGYLMAGDVFKTVNPTTGAKIDANNAYALRHGIELTF